MDPTLRINAEMTVVDTPNLYVTDVNPDGSRFLAVELAEPPVITELRFIKNWGEEVIERLAPNSEAN